MVVKILRKHSPTISAGTSGEGSASGRVIGTRQKLVDHHNPCSTHLEQTHFSVHELLDQIAHRHTQATVRAVLATDPAVFKAYADEVAEWSVQYQSLRGASA